MFYSTMLSNYSLLFVFKQKTAYEMRISDWSSDVCSSDLPATSSANGRLSSARRRMSDLAGRQTHDQTVERIAHRDLAGQPAGRFRIQRAVEPHFLFLGLRDDLGDPCVININVTSRT